MAVNFCAPGFMEAWRVLVPGYPPGDRQNGAFLVKPRGLKIIISSGMDWEHVSVSRRSRVPDYLDMVWVKNQFWGPDATVMQLHVPATDHVNCHPNCLHLWRPIGGGIPRPPAIMVGL